MVEATNSRPIQAYTRALIQSAKFSIRDVYDAIVELVTNSDDAYQRNKSSNGVIEIEVARKSSDHPNILRVRDCAGGMDKETMEKKLSFIGGRDSGLDRGEKVRGTHSRGAKDVAALGRVIFESIAEDNGYHKCEITPFLEFIPHDSKEITAKVREKIGITRGTGTLVTIELEKSNTLPLYSTLLKQIPRLVAIRGIVNDINRTVILRDIGKQQADRLQFPKIQGKSRVKDSLCVPGYEDVKVKLFIDRAKERFERENDRFRLGGILIESKRAVHQATLFDPALESDPYALWFYGRLVCPYIDDLCNEFDERFENHQEPLNHNPTYPIDPSRRAGLNREHPFVSALYGEVLKRLRPLVEEERQREEHERSRIENEATRKRLNALEKAALEYMRDYGEEEEIARDPDDRQSESQFLERGYTLSPPFTQMVLGHSRLFWINIRQDTFPELDVGSTVQIECLTTDISSDKHYCGLELHPNQEGILRSVWKVRAVSTTTATGLKVRVGSITADSIVEVLSSEADKYQDVTTLQFSKNTYSMRIDQKRKKIRILAPIGMVSTSTPFQVEVDSHDFEITGQQVLRPHVDLNIALCELSIKCKEQEASAQLTARLDSTEATAKIKAVKPMGADLSIKLEDIDLVNQRYRWRKNVLEIAARHPSLQRYLGDKEQGFPGQESKHFRVLVAEIVADAVCALVVRRTVQITPEDFEDADWDVYYALFSKHMTKFLPIAHKLQCPEG